MTLSIYGQFSDILLGGLASRAKYRNLKYYLWSKIRLSFYFFLLKIDEFLFSISFDILLIIKKVEKLEISNKEYFF